MARKRIELITGEIYHVIVRGIDGKDLFQDQSDYYRGIHDLFEFNDQDPVVWQFRKSFFNNSEDGPRNIDLSSLSFLGKGIS